MDNKVIWSSNGTMEYAFDLSPEEKLNFLVDRGYDPEMLADLSDNELNNVIENDDYGWQDDIDEFENEIAPMIARQANQGIVLLSGSAARWDGTKQGGLACDAFDLAGGDLDPSVDDIKIVDDGEGLVWEGRHHDGTHMMNLFALPEDERLPEFVDVCMQDYLDYYRDEELEEADLIEQCINDISIETLNEFCDFGLLADVCDRIKNEVNESLEESAINEVKAKDPQGLRAEYEEIKDLADEYGKEYFTSMPFTSYDDDPESVEKKYPNFFRVVKSFFKEMGILDGEELNDTDALDLEWDADIDDHDWEVIMRVCDRLTTPNKRSGKFEPSQFEKIYKDNFDDGLSDEKILADREAEDEFEEELEEECEDKKDTLEEDDQMSWPWGDPGNLN